jgi:hypothetical protein
MRTIHDQIQDYINGNLSDEEIHHLWNHFLCQSVWYDYFVTELTLHKILHSSNESGQHIYQQLWNLVEKKPLSCTLQK